VAYIGCGRHGTCHGRHFDWGTKIAWQKLEFVTCSFFNLYFAPPIQPLTAQLHQHSALIYLMPWFLTGIHAPLGVQRIKTRSGTVGSTKSFRDARPENFKNVLSIVVSAVNLIRSQALNHRLFKVFCNEVGAQHNALC